MAVNFPSSPTNGQTITVSGITYAYDSTQGVWSDSPQGLTQAIDALTDVDTSTAAPNNGQVLQWSSTDSEWQPADSSGAGVTVYATIDLLPLSGASTGDQAYVSGNNRLYIWNGSGWYNIALINTTPSISGASAAYALAIDGTATTVTLTATDPEGVPITYSIASDTSGNVATVTQGTGSNTNVFTITPSTNSAHVGTFSLTFRASDGVNIATAVSSFTLEFQVENSKYTTALITSAGANNAVNNSFDDASANNHTVTANGDVSQSTFSPYRSGGYSYYFDGAGDNLRITGGSTFSMAGDFTAECWIYCTATSNDYAGILAFSSDAESTGWNVLMRSNGKFHFNVGMTYTDSTGSVELNKWTHIALVRSGTGSGNCKLYIDGVADATTITKTGTVNQPTYIEIGGYPGIAARKFTGYITDARVVNGSAVYTSNFTPPVERLVAITNTSLLTCHLPYIADDSTNSHSITVVGDVEAEPFSPYDYLAYEASDNGGSAFFDGTGDYLNAGTNASLALGSGDFTFECWIYPPTATMANYAGIYSNTSDGQGDSNALRFGNLGTSSTTLAVQTATSSIFNSTSNAVKVGRWNHVALVRNGTATNNMTIYVNGVASGQGTSTANFSTGYATIGTNVYAGVHYLYSGYIADARVVQGTAVYTSAFTPPTAPLTAITNTSLLLNGTDAGIIDKSQSVKTITLYGNAKSSTTQTKFLSSSMYFDGTGDYLAADDQNVGDFGTQDFTAEGWFYLTTSPASYTSVCETRGSANTATGWTIAINGSGSFYVYSAGFICQAANSSISSNTWYHWAYSRESGNHKLFLNGTQVGSTSTAAKDYTDTNFRIGANFSGAEIFTGYQSDVRITKGLARYTSNFTVPSAALQG